MLGDLEHLLALLGSGLTVCDDWLGDLDGRTAHEVLLQILEADLDVQLSASGDDVLSALLGHADDERVALGEALESLDELGQILRILGLDGDAHDGAHRVLHGAEVVRGLVVADGSGLDDVLVDSDKSAGVSGGDVLDLLDVASHHDDGALDGLEVEASLLSRDVLWRRGGPSFRCGRFRKRRGQSVEPGVGGVGGDHLGDVHHERAVGVAVADSDGALVIEGPS